MKCFWIFFHKWGKWELTDARVVLFSNYSMSSGNGKANIRKCERCGLSQVRKLT